MMDAITFYRSELVRQRDLLQSVWRWYLLPFVPGFIVTITGRVLQQGAPWSRLIGTLAVVAGLMWVVWWGNQRAAARLQERIDALDEPDGPHFVAARTTLAERLIIWTIVAFVLATLSGAALALLGLDPLALVPGADTLPVRTRRLAWFPLVLITALAVQAVWWAARGRKNQS
jgi:hypothetical protein